MPKLAAIPVRPAFHGLAQHIHHVVAGREIERQRRGQEDQEIGVINGHRWLP